VNKTAWLLLSLLLAPVVMAGENDCLQSALQNASAEITVGELKQQCQLAQQNSLDARAQQERAARYNPFTITAHKPNYLLPLSYNLRPNNLGVYDYDLQRSEIKFQMSFKFPIGPALWDGRLRFYGAYTHQSWWQAYNSRASAPFRETNHEPELFAVMPLSLNPWGVDAAFLTLGLSHQSNGQSGLRSRSWNRVYANLALEKGAWVVALKPWLRLPEDEKENPNDPKGDDNPDIEQFTGHFELGLFRRYEQGSSLSLIVRHNFSSHKGALQLGYSYPLNKRFKGYVEFFDGYAESLIDYNHHGTRLGIGILLTDWL
jgi:phospholipase A1